jgi:ubiquinone/menaquinone biosynthesis C-methylase UbiE
MVAGVDWLPSATKLSSDLSKGYSTIAGDARRLPLDDRTFTKIIAQHVIEHFEDPVSVLREWRRVLKPGGVVLLITPNQRFPELDWFYDPSHHHIYTSEELAQLVVSSGFKVATQRIINPFFISTKFHSFAAKYLQWFYRFPSLSRRGMSLIFLAVKAGE